ncbi:response regulator transcription factor [Synechocystis sp. LKSZ1]|uniref:response regulator transcription factor n=1 Tax=Synechocystis sp. LKSZ1 TaxID=3144951 RepID=UPI00336BDFD8
MKNLFLADAMRILIVEDDPLMQLGLEQALSEQANFTVIGRAEDGYSAVQQALALMPDLIVMDIGLPGLDGIAATKQIKAQRPQVHIVMLTSHTLQTEVVAALSSGADAYCVKGASLERLLAAIEAAKEGATYLDPQIARLVVENLKAPVNPVVPGLNALSEREMDVLKLIVEGKSNQEIASELYLSTNTIKTHVRGIMNKLSVDDRVQAAVLALRSGLV